ncbi:MAG: hypothetical protein ACQER9_04765 [Nanobdellota archaeon]
MKIDNNEKDESNDIRGLFALYASSIISIIIFVWAIMERLGKGRGIFVDENIFKVLISGNNGCLQQFFLKYINPDNYLGPLLPIIVFIMLGLLIAFLSFIFFRAYKKRKLIKDDLILSAIIFLVMPPFAYFLINMSSDFYALFLLILSLFFSVSFNGKIKWLSYIFSLLLAFTSFESAFLASFFYLMFGIYYKKKEIFNNYIIAIFFIIIKSLFIGGITFFSRHNIREVLLSSVRETGVFYGISFFFIIAGLAGLILISQRRFTFSIISMLLMFLFLLEDNVLYFSFIMVYFTVVFLRDIFSRKWKMESLRIIGGSLIVFFIIFNAMNFSLDYVVAEPSENMIESYELIRDEINEGNIIVPSDKNNRMRFFTTLETFPEDDKENDVVEQIYFSSVLERTDELFLKNKIEYVYISDDMISSIWDDEIKGLRTHLNNEEYFEKVLESDDFKVYRYKG